MSFFFLFLNEISILLDGADKTDGPVKRWKQLQEENDLTIKLTFKWIQLIHSLPKLWIGQIFIGFANSINLAIQDHHLIKKH